MTASIGTYIYEELTRNPAVAALVSTRIYPGMIPQDADLPAIAYQQISNPPTYSHSGNSGLWNARVQLICVAANYLAAHALSETVRLALDGKKNLSTLRAACFIANVFDRAEIGPEILENSVQIDVEISYQEAG